MDFLNSDAVTVIDRLIQWFIIPAAVLIWTHNKRLAAHDSEILRLATILEERERNRDRDRSQDREVIKELKQSIDKLNERLDHIVVDKK